MKLNNNDHNGVRVRIQFVASIVPLITMSMSIQLEATLAGMIAKHKCELIMNKDSSIEFFLPDRDLFNVLACLKYINTHHPGLSALIHIRAFDTTVDMTLHRGTLGIGWNRSD